MDITYTTHMIIDMWQLSLYINYTARLCTTSGGHAHRWSSSHEEGIPNHTNDNNNDNNNNNDDSTSHDNNDDDDDNDNNDNDNTNNNDN